LKSGVAATAVQDDKRILELWSARNPVKCALQFRPPSYIMVKTPRKICNPFVSSVLCWRNYLKKNVVKPAGFFYFHWQLHHAMSWRTGVALKS
jgi:hypothetical protein